MATWTAPADVATLDVETAAAWNLLLGTAGSLAYLKAGGGGTMAYKTSTQVFTTNTAYADVSASSGSFAFAIAASEVWEAYYYIPLSFGGTGGAKFQITGPSAPTNVDITGYDNRLVSTSTTDNLCQPMLNPFSAVTSFSTGFVTVNSVATQTTADAGKYWTGLPTLVFVRARITNGANAGTVTLQAAQNSSNSTSTLGIGSTMFARRIA